MKYLHKTGKSAQRGAQRPPALLLPGDERGEETFQNAHAGHQIKNGENLITNW